MHNKVCQSSQAIPYLFGEKNTLRISKEWGGDDKICILVSQYVQNCGGWHLSFALLKQCQPRKIILIFCQSYMPLYSIDLEKIADLDLAFDTSMTEEHFGNTLDSIPLPLCLPFGQKTEIQWFRKTKTCALSLVHTNNILPRCLNQAKYGLHNTHFVSKPQLEIHFKP